MRHQSKKLMVSGISFIGLLLIANYGFATPHWRATCDKKDADYIYCCNLNFNDCPPSGAIGFKSYSSNAINGGTLPKHLGAKFDVICTGEKAVLLGAGFSNEDEVEGVNYIYRPAANTGASFTTVIIINTTEVEQQVKLAYAKCGTSRN